MQNDAQFRLLNVDRIFVQSSEIKAHGPDGISDTNIIISAGNKLEIKNNANFIIPDNLNINGLNFQTQPKFLNNELSTKQYVDSVIQGLDIKESVKVTTTTNIILNGIQTIDGIVLSEDDRILVKNQNNSVENAKLEEQVMLMKKLMEKQMEKQKKEMEEKFKKEIQELKKNNNQITNNTNNNTNNNTTNIEEQNNIENNIETNIENNIEKVENNFIINNFGYENTDIFDEEERMISYIRKPFNALPNMIEKLHFTPSKRPENTNIRINNISNGKSQIYKYKWVTIMKHDLIFDLFKINAERLIYTYETYLEEGKIERLSWIEKFRYQFENDDKYFYKTQQEKIDCKLVDCMKKNKSYMNGL